jgi:hypothetical protein
MIEQEETERTEDLAASSVISGWSKSPLNLHANIPSEAKSQGARITVRERA